jgi:hypothetical protein
MTENKHIIDDKLTLKELILNIQFWISYLTGKWKIFLLALLIGGALGALYSQLKKPVFHAHTSFVLEDSEMGGMGSVSGLASLVGVNLGSLGSSSGLFKGDNIMELYKSDLMLSQALLMPFDSQYQLIDKYISYNELDEKWKSKVDISNMDFSVDRNSFTVSQDSVLKEVVKLIRKNHLSVAKPDRKLSIIKVTVDSKDEKFAKAFNEALVEKVNTFYLETKTKKTFENLRILQSQADSVKQVLDQSLTAFASSSDRVPNPNPLLLTGTVETKKRQVDVQASSAVYSEIVKNLEIAKVNHRNNSPLLQIIDSPRFPLERTEVRLLKGVVFGAVLASVIMLIFLYLYKTYRNSIAD